MRNALFYINRIIPIAGFMLMAGWLVNCNQFHSFSNNENANILSVQPVLSDNIVEQTFDGGSSVNINNNNNGGTGSTDVTVTDDPSNGGTNTGGTNTGGTNTGGTNSGGTTVDDTILNPTGPGAGPSGTTLQPAFIDCSANNEYQLLRDDLVSYTSCQRCDVLNRDQADGTPGVCTVRIAPRPEPTVVATTTEPDNDIWANDSSGGDGDGDGDGDPLMIDTQGQIYGNAEDFSSKWFDRDNYITAGELELTSPQAGTKFDLFGQQIDFQIMGKEIRVPEAIAGTDQDPRHFKYQISWTQSKRYRFLVLPNEKGDVTGIDELFGDNTLGPDKDFAVDGFHALAKYDGRSADGSQSVGHRDGFIDSTDPIYDRLRLWVDIDDSGDAIGADRQALELITLRQARIRSIHLYPSTKFYERDVYGNEIMYKAVVQFEHSNPNNPDEFRAGIAFDVWFDWNPEENQRLMDVWTQQ